MGPRASFAVGLACGVVGTLLGAWATVLGLAVRELTGGARRWR